MVAARTWCSRIALAAGLFALVVGPSLSAHGQLELIPDPQSLVKHERKLSPQKFAFAPEQRTRNPDAVDRPVFAYEFGIEGMSVRPGNREYDGKPDCLKSDVRQNPVLIDSPELSFFDIVFYNPDDPAQARRSELWPGPTAPYLVGDLSNPFRLNERQQQFARFFDIRCLPTRIHYIRRGEQRIEQYREGEYAWDESVSSTE